MTDTSKEAVERLAAKCDNWDISDDDKFTIAASLRALLSERDALAAENASLRGELEWEDQGATDHIIHPDDRREIEIGTFESWNPYHCSVLLPRVEALEAQLQAADALVEAAEGMCAHWDSTDWVNKPHTGEKIRALRSEAASFRAARKNRACSSVVELGAHNA